MAPDKKSALKDGDMMRKLLELTEDNHRILKELERSMRMSYIWTGIKVAIVVVPILLGYLYLLPFLDKINRIYGAVGGNSSSTLSNSITKIIHALQQ